MWTTIMGRVMRESSGSASVAMTCTLSPPLSAVERVQISSGSQRHDAVNNANKKFNVSH